MKKLLKQLNMKRIVAVVVSLMIVFASTALTANIFKYVKLTDGEREITLKTYSTSTSEILSQADITLGHADEIKRAENENMIYIEVLRAFPVDITYHGDTLTEHIADGTVGEVLTQAGVSLEENDVINVGLDTELYDGIEIEVDKIEFVKKTLSKTVEYDTVYEESDDYPQGYEEVTAQGKDGKAQTITTYKYINGELDSVCGEVTKVVTEPQSQVVLKGTAQTVAVSDMGSTTTSVGSGESSESSVDGLSYSKVLTGSATAYTASQGALTATGVPAYVGGVAVNPNIIPYGSKLYIVADGYTYGYATAVDTGGALMNGSALVDLYMSTYDECINFGRRNVTVYVLN